MQWDKVTDIILATALAVLAVFAGLGLYQWIARKSLKNVDLHLKAFIPPLALMTLTYIIFDKFIILSLRPDGSGEPSFPSTHSMVVTTIFLIVMLALPRYVKQKPLRITLDIVMTILIILVSIGRIAAGKHWPTDVVCGLVFAAIFAGIYYLLVKKGSSNAKHLHENH
ncbi:phosphatase PAP2 family protein [Candidatus Saccharibacteria bacterium]|nr:phosphatase PAP2 family protein [Candidatus Saccharibacteria bacterium]